MFPKSKSCNRMCSFCKDIEDCTFSNSDREKPCAENLRQTFSASCKVTSQPHCQLKKSIKDKKKCGNGSSMGDIYMPSTLPLPPYTHSASQAHCDVLLVASPQDRPFFRKVTFLEIVSLYMYFVEFVIFHYFLAIFG